VLPHLFFNILEEEIGWTASAEMSSSAEMPQFVTQKMKSSGLPLGSQHLKIINHQNLNIMNFKEILQAIAYIAIMILLAWAGGQP